LNSARSERVSRKSGLGQGGWIRKTQPIVKRKIQTMPTKKINFSANEMDMEILNELKHELSVSHSLIIRAAIHEYKDRHKKDKYAKLYNKSRQKIDIFPIIENRGKVSHGIGLINRIRVKLWLIQNPTGTGKECAESLGLHTSTACKHLAKLRAITGG